MSVRDSNINNEIYRQFYKIDRLLPNIYNGSVK